jgi:hypothetical protein
MKMSKMQSETSIDNSVSLYTTIDADSVDTTHPDQLEFDFDYGVIGSSYHTEHVPYDMLKQVSDSLPDDMFEELLVDMVKINHASETS